MIEFFPPILEHFRPLFLQIAQMGLILPRWDLILPRIPPATPVLYSAVTNPFRGYVHTQNTPSPTPKYPFFLAWFWEWAKWTTVWAKWTTSGQNVWNVGKTFLEVGKKNYSSKIRLGKQTVWSDWHCQISTQKIKVETSKNNQAIEIDKNCCWKNWGLPGIC